MSFTKIHPTAIISKGAELDASVEIGPWCTIGPHVKIKKNTKLISHVVVDGHTTLGESNVVFPFAVLGAVPQDLKYKGEPTELLIGDQNTIRESVTINLGTVQGGGYTKVGSHNLLMAYVHLGHDCLVGSHTIIANACSLAGHVEVHDYAIIGGMSGVSQFVRVGAHSYTGGHAGIDRDIPPFAYAMGTKPVYVKGTNLVGLKRRGYSNEVIQQVNESLKLWVRPDIQKEQCLSEIEALHGSSGEVMEFISFIRKSKMGVTRFIEKA